MRHPSIRSIVMVIAIVVGSANIARAQSGTSTEGLTLNAHNTWEGAQLVGSSWASKSKRRIVVVTTDKPDRRQGCRVQSFTADELVCARAFGGSRTYKPQQVLALIIPGGGGARVPILIGMNAGLGAAIWGTVVLVATCPACAAATAFAAFYFLVGQLFVAYDDQPDRLLYFAPGKQLSGKLGNVQK